MLLEEFENVAGVIEPTNRQIQNQDKNCETIILSFNGEIVNRLVETGTVRDGGYLKSLSSLGIYMNKGKLKLLLCWLLLEHQ